MQNISLRDYFAAQIMSGISMSVYQDAATVEDRAKLAYIYADTLIWARTLDSTELGSSDDLSVSPRKIKATRRALKV